jgi:hypothetical protein
MSLTEIILTILILGMIVGGLLLLKKSARKFDLTTEQLEKIKKRNDDLDRENDDN